MIIDRNPQNDLDKEKEYAVMRFSFGTIMCCVVFGVASSLIVNAICQLNCEMRQLRQSIERLEDPHVKDFLNKYYYRQQEPENK